MQNEIFVYIRTEHFRRATSYTDAWGCPLTLAVRDIVNISEENEYLVSCCLGSVTIRNLEIGINFGYEVTCDWCDLQTLYTGELEGKTINQMIIMAKEDPNLEFPPLVLKLTLREKWNMELDD